MLTTYMERALAMAPASSIKAPPFRSAGLSLEQPNLQSLLERARKLQSSTRDAVANLPSVALGLDQIESQSRALAARAHHELGGLRDGTAHRDAKAQYLLASAHVNTDALTQSLDRLDPIDAFAPLQPLQDNDIEGYIRHAHESTIINTIEENRRRIVSDFYRSLEIDLHASWDREKQAVLDELSRHSSESAASSASWRDGMLNPPSLSQAAIAPLPQALGMDARLRRYEHAVQNLNAARQRSIPFDIVDAFASAARSTTTDSRNSRLLSAWHLLSLLCRDEQSADPKVIEQAAYARAYRGPEGSAEAIQMRKSLVRGALAYLEEFFLVNVVEKELSEKVNQAQIGGVPSIAKKIEAFVRLEGGRARWPSVELFRVEGREEALWANLFFLVRCGHGHAAANYAKQHEAKIKASSPDFVTSFSHWQASSRQLSKTEHDIIASFYTANLHHASSVDPFKLALHKILARAELARKRLPAVTERTEDWIWLQLSMTREEQNSFGVERWSLLDLGRDIATKYNSETFGSVYFHLLLLSGQFEKAVATLYSRSQQQVDAVHLGVALAYFGLLRTPAQSSASDVELCAHLRMHTYAVIESLANGRYELDLDRLIYRHYRNFAQAAPQQALQYICLIPLGHYLQDETVDPYRAAQAYTRDLVIDSQAYAVLLGGLNHEGVRQTGAIERCGSLLVPPGENPTQLVRALIREVAQRAESDKSFATAIELFNLADEAENVMRVLISELGRALGNPVDLHAASANGAMLHELAQEDPFAAAKALLGYYAHGRAGQRVPSERAVATCQSLLKLRQAFVASRQGAMAEALDTIRATNLIPLETGDVTVIMRRAEDAKEVDEALSRNYGEILLLAMNLLYQLHAQLKESPYSDAGRQAKMDEYRLQARSLMTFAGMLRFRLPSGVFEQLTRLSVFLH